MTLWGYFHLCIISYVGRIFLATDLCPGYFRRGFVRLMGFILFAVFLHTRVLRVSRRYQLGFIAADIFLDYLCGLFPLLFIGLVLGLKPPDIKGFLSIWLFGDFSAWVDLL